jgi:hypothetical protein
VVACGALGTRLDDLGSFARQIGVLPPQGSPAERLTKVALNASTRLRRLLPFA